MLTIPRKKFTLEEYHRLGEIGFFQEDEQVELIRGEIILMPLKKTPHSACNTRLGKQLYQLIGNQATIRIQEPVILPNDSEPQPDAAIVINKEDDYLSSHPCPQDILLLIEISDTTLKYDQEVKLKLYAEDEITHYWILNLVDNYLEAYSEPYQEPKGGYNYRVKRIYLINETVDLPSFPDLSLDLSLVFPRSIL